jgi:hypothetical protein
VVAAPPIHSLPPGCVVKGNKVSGSPIFVHEKQILFAHLFMPRAIGRLFPYTFISTANSPFGTHYKTITLGPYFLLVIVIYEAYYQNE